MLPKIAPFDFGEEAIFAGEAAQVACFVIEGDHPMESVGRTMGMTWGHW